MAQAPKSMQPSQTVKTVGLCFGFGLSLAAEIYIIGILFGGWLDNKLGSAPWCTIGGTLLAIGAAFWLLLRGLDFWREREEQKNTNP